MKQIPPVLWLVLLIAIVAIAAAAAKGKKGSGRLEKPTRRQPLTEREQAMFFRLTQTFPDHVVLAQVAFSALLNAKATAVRNTFDKKVADFVLCSKAFEVIAAIEVDDSSHRSKGEQDAKRDLLLAAAGYKVLRFKQVPDTEDLIRAVAALAPAKPSKG